MSSKQANSKKTESEVVIREYTEDQQKQVYSLILSIFEMELKGIPSAGYLNDIHTIHDVYGGERNRFWTASIGERVVGTIAIKEDSETEAMMRRLFVSPAHRSQGIAQRLFQEAVHFSRQADYKSLIFIGNNRMHRARKALLKYGFKEIEEIDLGEIKIFKSVYDL